MTYVTFLIVILAILYEWELFYWKILNLDNSNWNDILNLAEFAYRLTLCNIKSFSG